MMTLPAFHWSDFFWAAALLLGIYFVLKVAKELFSKAYFLGKWQSALQQIIHSILLVYEIIALLILISVFVLINPPFHGLMVLFFLLAGFAYFRNYLSGRLVQLDENLHIGQRIRTGSLTGIINHLGHFGIRIKNREGNHQVSYHQLMQNGYSLLTPEEVGGLYQLALQPSENLLKKGNPIILLEDLLITTPFLDWKHRPEISKTSGEPVQLDVRVLVQEDAQVGDLISMIEEWGYTVALKEG